MSLKQKIAAVALIAVTAGVAAAHAAEAARTFHVAHEYKVARAATVWVPLPSDDAWQTVRDLHVDGAPWERVYDSRWGNLAARVHASAAATISVRYEVTRKERGRRPCRVPPRGRRRRAMRRGSRPTRACRSERAFARSRPT